jgi:hypothetical protein
VRNHDRLKCILKQHLRKLTMGITEIILASIPLFAVMIILLEDKRIKDEKAQG